MGETNWTDYPHRCRYCEYADPVIGFKHACNGGTDMYKCEKTGAIVDGNRIPACYACPFYKEKVR